MSEQGLTALHPQVPRASHIEGELLLDRMEALGRLGRAPDGAVSRVAFTDEFLAGRELVEAMMRAEGLGTWVDGAGNLFGRSQGGRPGPGDAVIVVGSHLDTVPAGGLLDGAYGVLAAISAVAALHRAVPLAAASVVVAGFCNEEGAFGTAGMTGSRAMAVGLPAEEMEATTAAGATLAAHLESVAGPGENAGSTIWAPGSVAAYLEAHIEQGPVLERSGRDIGLVRAITGRELFDVSFSGTQGHAGTTPMDARADALAAAAEAVLAVERLAHDGLVRVATVGGLECEPGSRNIIAGRACLRGEVRDSSAPRMGHALAVLGAQLDDICARRGTRAEIVPVGSVPPVPTDRGLTAVLGRAARRLGVEALELDSGAGHDAQSLAGVAPVAMIFVPSIAGASHCRDEASSPASLVLGADVLAVALAELTGAGPE